MHQATVGGIYDSTPPTLVDGQAYYLRVDSRGRLLSSQAVVGGEVTYTDKTITSATGSSQTIMAANASRKSLIIQAISATVGVNINGGTAAIGGAGTLVLLPGKDLILSGAECPVGAITIITTAATYVPAYEGA
jgi:hypothetical protein